MTNMSHILVFFCFYAMKNGGNEKCEYYTKPELLDLSQGSRIAFARQFRFMTQDNVSDRLGLTGECKRRTMTRYEKGERNPKDDRTSKIAEILNVSINVIMLK